MRPALWDIWVGQGGEGIVLKEWTSLYRPGVRAPAWLKLKPKLALQVVVTGGSTDRVRWGTRELVFDPLELLERLATMPRRP